MIADDFPAIAAEREALQLEEAIGRITAALAKAVQKACGPLIVTDRPIITPAAIKEAVISYLERAELTFSLVSSELDPDTGAFVVRYLPPVLVFPPL